MAVVRYLVDDVEKAIAFYTDKLGFGLEQSMGPAFAIVSRGDLSLWLSGPQSSGARPMPDGRQPEPGGWNRLVLAVDVPSGLHAGTGQPLGAACVRADHCLTLLTMKPGLFTAAGRDHAGVVWFEDLGVDTSADAPDAWLIGADARPLDVSDLGSAR